MLPTSFELGGSADFELKIANKGSTVQVEVVTSEAQGLKAAYLDLAYDTSRFTPLGAQSTELLASGSDKDIVELAVTGDPGTVHHGQVLARPQTATGFTGSGAVAIFTFAKQALPRTVAAAPDTDFSETQLSWASPGTLTWRFASAGDYDQNGEVNLSDLSRLSVRLGNSVAPGAFAFDSADSVADGDANGQVNIADITPIGANYGASVRKYLVYSSANLGDYPASNSAASSVPVVGQVAVDDTQDSAIEVRVSYSFPVPSPAEAAHYWVRPADTADAPGTPSNSVQYFAPNLSPVANLLADQNSVPIGTTVTFDAGGSSDSDGTIVKYEYDWDGNGTAFDWEDLALNTAPTHQFDTAGSFVVKLRVTDDKGAWGVSQTIVDVLNVQPPTADIDADVTSGDAPLSVVFDASGSLDADGTITNYLWDLDGDSVFETDTGLISSAFFFYDTAGVYSATVQVTDNDGLTAIASIDITVTDGGGGGDPVADISADQTSGFPGLLVNFSGGWSFDDGTIDKYEWDFEGDGIYDLDTADTPSASFTYNDSGDFNATLRVTDDDGNTDTASIPIQILGGVYARLTITPRYGGVPLTCALDASASFSTDGSIDKYEWDWDNDGIYDLDSGSDPTVDHDFLTPGIFDTKVRVTDSIAATDEKIMLVYAMANDGDIPDDSIFALPSQSFCAAGEAVGIEIYTKNAANPFQYMSGARMTMPAGNTYKSMTQNIGTFGNVVDFADGVWETMNAFGFLIPPDNFIQISDIGGGMEAIDLNVTPLGGVDLLLATGAMINFELIMNSDSTFAFQRLDIVARTYYQDGNQAPEHYWSNENVPGLPGVDVQ